MAMKLDEYCRIYYGLKDGERPTKSQRNSVSRMCREKRLDAVKSGSRWFIKEKELEDG